MEENILNKNLAEISKYNKKLADKIANHSQFEHDFEFLEAKSGDIILSYNGIPLHDEVDPQDEASKTFNSTSSNSKSAIHLLFGLGLGYLFKRFTLNCKGKIIVFEPNIDILRITLETVDFSQELSRQNVAIIDSKQDIQKCFDRFYFGDASVQLSFLKSYTKLYPELFQDIVSELGFVKGLYGCNYENLFELCYGWTIAGILNIPEVLRNDDVESLHEKFKDKPAVIISAGPSLNKNIDILREYQDKVITFCVGPALKTTINHGINPDFLTIVENQDCSFQITGQDLSNINLILQPMTHHNIHLLPAKRHFNYYPNNDFTAKWITQILDINIDEYYNRGTVSLCALFSAIIMGCNPIIIVGQDLAYTDGQCYANGTPFQDLRLIKNNETGDFELKFPENTSLADIVDPEKKYRAEHQAPILENILKEAKSRIDNKLENLILVKGQNGEMIPTESGYATFIRYFENVAVEFGSRIKLINATEGGAYLEGFEHIPLKQTLEKYSKTIINVESITQEALKSSNNLHKEKSQIILQEIDKTIELLEKSLPYFAEGKIYTEKLVKQVHFNRIYSDSFKKDCEQVLKNFLAIEQEILNNSYLSLGLIYPEYTKLTHHLSHFDNVDINSIKKLVKLVSDLFIDRYKKLIEFDIERIKQMRQRLYESCNTTS